MLMGEAKSAVEFMRRWPRRKRETKRTRAKMRPPRQVFPQFNIISVPVAQCVIVEFLLFIGVLLSMLNLKGGTKSALEFMRRWPRRKRERKRSRAKMRPLRQVFAQLNI